MSRTPVPIGPGSYVVPALARRLLGPLSDTIAYCLDYSITGTDADLAQRKALARRLRRRRPELWQWLEEERVRQALATGAIQPIEDVLIQAVEQYQERRGHVVIPARLWAAVERAAEESGLSPAEIVQAAVVQKYA